MHFIDIMFGIFGEPLIILMIPKVMQIFLRVVKKNIQGSITLTMNVFQTNLDFQWRCKKRPLISYFHEELKVYTCT